MGPLKRVHVLVIAGLLLVALGGGVLWRISRPGHPAAGAATELPRDGRRCGGVADAQLTELDKLDARVAAAADLGASHRKSLNAASAAARVGLQGLEANTGGAPDAATPDAACASLAATFGVADLHVPRANLVIAADAESAAIAKLQALETALATAIDQASARGGQTASAREALARVHAKVSDAAALTAGVADRLCALGPRDLVTNPGALKASRTAIRTASDDLKAVRASLRAIATTLEAAGGATSTSSPP